MLLQEIEPAPHAAQHAEREHIDLHQAERIDVVLVPFDEGAIVHGGVADRHGLVEPARGSARSRRHAARDGAESRSARWRDARPARIAGLSGSSPAWRICSSGSPSLIAPDGLGQRRRHVRRQPQRLADLADRAARAIVDDGRADRGAIAPVALVNILDHLLAPLVLEIDVDVGRLAAVLRNEAGEQKLGLVRIDRGDAEAKADGAVGRRAAALAENFFVLPARIGTTSWTVRK